MELRQLKYFEAVASTLNFSRAAERLNIAQPPLSRQIQQLEDELGVLLLDRATRPMKLTNAGAFFYDQTVQLLGRLAEIEIATKRLGAGRGRFMGVGFVPSALYTFVPRVVRQFADDHPTFDVSLLELTTVQQIDALLTGRIDIGFHRLPIANPHIENRILRQDRLVLAMNVNNRLTREREVEMKEILDEVLILYPAAPRPSFADQTLQHFSRRGLFVRKTYEANGLQTALGLVAAGIGVSIIPESAERLRSSDVAYRPFAEQDLTSPMVMSVRAGAQPDHISSFCSAIEIALAAENAELARERAKADAR